MNHMHEPFVKHETSGRIATLTFNRPDVRNAISTLQDCADLVNAVEAAERDDSVSCIILTGCGGAFCAGGNIRAMQERSGIGPTDSPAGTRSNYRRGVQSVIAALWKTELPMIAAINGHAIGLGLDIACLCDLRICADTAKFASSFIRLGIVPGDGGAWILPRAIGNARAAELMLTGDTYDARAALSMGLVSSVVPAGGLMAEGHALAARIVANPARTLRLTKRLLREGQQQRLQDMLELSASFQAIAHETSDHHEAVHAFLEKREPRFTGS
jgi:2-(1,2-epoxy-1,2-dihydrophenyl)acetyl-CoA isomerase